MNSSRGQKKSKIPRALSESTRTGRRRSPKVLERSLKQRAQILDAAARVIGRCGYAGCSISRVAKKAKVAHGSVYLQFSSQQELFDEVLLSSVANMLEAVGQATRGARSVRELEEKGMRANLRHLTENPHLYRVSSEAEVYAPEAFKRHFDEINRRYSSAIRRLLQSSIAEGPNLDNKVTALAAMLEGARMRLLLRFGVKEQKYIGLPDHALETYLRFVTAGIEAVLGTTFAVAP
jgi:AcrR family transcriptional regulator